MTRPFAREGLFIGAGVVTMDPKGPQTADAVLVADGHITAVGAANDLVSEAEAGGIDVIDCGDSTILPGFVDGHCHFEMATTVEVGWVHVHTPPYSSLAEIANEIARQAAVRSSDQWLLCRSSFSMHEKVEERRLFTREELDEVCGDRPVAVFASLHVCSLNTLALKALDLWEPNSIHREHGVVHRSADGTPTGVVTEAFLLIPAVTGERAFKSAVVDKAANHWNPAGTTTVHTMPESIDQARWEMDLHNRRELSLRQRHYFISPAVGDVAAIANLRKLYDEGDELLRFGGIKLFANGCAHDGYGHALNDPKFTQEELDDIVLEAHRHGIQVWIHSLNSQGIASAATAIGRAADKLPRPHRHRIEHGGDYVDLRDLDLINRSGALLVTTPQFLYSTSSDLSEKHAPWRTLIEHGIRLVGATDSTGTVPDSIAVLRNVAVAVGRHAADGRQVGPEEAVTVQEALSMFTTWSSYGGFEEHVKGRIAPGYFADFAILDKNPLTTPIDEIANIQVLKTVLGGQVVHSA
ncbi:amidohydrolase [Streptomyces sp. NPDC056002]|uniref:amidohydrolase n=1 Tax=Streptomyces sp. NPDC056002 TaxID=3345675 RepID=UPI0035DA142F